MMNDVRKVLNDMVDVMNKLVDDEKAEIPKCKVEPKRSDPAEKTETQNVQAPKVEAKTAPKAKDETHSILVKYSYIGDGCDARVVVPANTSDLRSVTDISYALCYAIADVVAPVMMMDREKLATSFLEAVCGILTEDTLRMILEDD